MAGMKKPYPEKRNFRLKNAFSETLHLLDVLAQLDNHHPFEGQFYSDFTKEEKDVLNVEAFDKAVRNELKRRLGQDGYQREINMYQLVQDIREGKIKPSELSK